MLPPNTTSSLTFQSCRIGPRRTTVGAALLMSWRRDCWRIITEAWGSLLAGNHLTSDKHPTASCLYLHRHHHHTKSLPLPRSHLRKMCWSKPARHSGKSPTLIFSRATFRVCVWVNSINGRHMTAWEMPAAVAGSLFYFYTTGTTLQPANLVLLSCTRYLQIADMSRGSDYAFSDTYYSSSKEKARGLREWCSRRKTSYNPFLMTCSEMHKAERMRARGCPGNVFP